MALSVGLLGRSLLSCRGLRPAYVSQLRAVTIQSRPAEIPPEETHDERNMRMCRPQSPHLTIYKFELPALLSITHRFTGGILGAYATTFAAASLLSNRPITEVITDVSSSYPTFYLLFKCGLIFPFSYHFFNGIRHLVWITAATLTKKGVYITGYIMLFCSLITSCGLMYLAEQQKGKTEPGNKKCKDARGKVKCKKKKN